MFGTGFETAMDDLNERQRKYLLAALEVDQHVEQMHKMAFQRGRFDEASRPATDWRAMPFGVNFGYGGAVPTMLRKECGGADEGSGSTWAALERRGLLSVRERETYGYSGQVLPHIALTPKGRKLARILKGEPLAAKPKGALARATWKALAAGWKAGEQGLWDERGGDWYGGVNGDIWLMLTRSTRTGPAWFTTISRSAPEGRPTFL